MSKEEKQVNRRSFLSGLGRVALAGLLVGGMGWLSSRPERACGQEGPCRVCPRLRSCTLPGAEEARDLRPGER